MATRPAKTPDKSPRAGELVKPKHGVGLIRHGSAPGTNRGGTGRPPDEFRAACAKLADDTLRRGYVEGILKDPSHPQFMRALEWAADRGYGKTPQAVEHTGAIEHGVILLPPLGERRE